MKDMLVMVLYIYPLDLFQCCTCLTGCNLIAVFSRQWVILAVLSLDNSGYIYSLPRENMEFIIDH